MSKEKELEVGKMIEQEHKDTIKKIITDAENDSEKAKNSISEYVEDIAKDHIEEIPNYYTGKGGLLDMEEKLKQDLKNKKSTQVLKDAVPFLLDLNQRYRKQGMDLMKALRVWGENNLTVTDVQELVKGDVHTNLCPREAAYLLSLAKKMAYQSEDLYSERIADTERAYSYLNSKRVIPLTPYVKRLVDKVSSTHYQSKVGGVMWKIIVDNDQLHLARIEEEGECEDKK
jgi:hypothetical protein